MIRIVIADDSAIFREAFKEKIESSGKIRVVGSARNGREAIELVQETCPDLLVLDCQMPVMDGLECLKKIKHQWPGPVVMLSSLTYKGAAVTIQALEYGAVDFLHKPVGGAQELNQVVGMLIEKIEVIILQGRLKGIREKYRPFSAGETILSGLDSKVRRVDLVCMGSSTGGVQASMDIIPKLPAHMQPVVWVQHMPPPFIKSLAKRLDSLSGMQVKIGEDGENVCRGICYLAPGIFQMRIRRKGDQFQINIGGEERVSSHSPSCDVLFESVADHCTRNVIGVILSGMGDDGARGIEKMHSRGAFVIGQSQESCVVYGMPKMAYERGAVDIELDSRDIAEGIRRVAGLN
jgi:two-component system chemotaxis response regulator CheB